MRLHELEAWTLEVVSHVREKRTWEDARVELKANLPLPPEKAARRLAGHANAARGAQILWLVGVDEQDGVVGVGDAELQEWWPQVARWFEGIEPSLTDLRVPTGDRLVLALLFPTDRPPYVVKNPKGGAPQFEVPWRDGTRIRTAKREELLRLLLPARLTPSFETISARVSVNWRPSGKGTFTTQIRGTLYQARMLDAPVVLPSHRTEGRLIAPNDSTLVEVAGLSLTEALRPAGRTDGWIYQTVGMNRPPQHRSMIPAGQLQLDGPGRVNLEGYLSDMSWDLLETLVDAGPIALEIEADVLEGAGPVTVRIDLGLPESDSEIPGEEDPVDLTEPLPRNKTLSLRWTFQAPRDCGVDGSPQAPR